MESKQKYIFDITRKKYTCFISIEFYSNVFCERYIGYAWYIQFKYNVTNLDRTRTRWYVIDGLMNECRCTLIKNKFNEMSDEIVGWYD